jgi:ADP-heptose:LPS heptosyltransferase
MIDQNKILVIKLSALGDFIIALGAMRAIRKHHKNDHITLLTTKPYQSLAESCGYFDEVIIDKRPKFHQISKWWDLKKALNKEDYSRVYDLQINDRTALYYRLLNSNPEWIGTLKKSDRDKSGLAFYRHKKMLEKLAIKDIEIDKMDWMKGDISQFSLKSSYALIVPGCAPSRPEKRWPASYFTELCQKLIKKNIQPVLIGTNDESSILNEITDQCPNALNLLGQTKLFDIAALARNAKLAVGNDTGPMHIIGPTDCPSIVLFSNSSDPSKHAPLGQNIQTIQKDNIADISVDDVFKKIKNLI